MRSFGSHSTVAVRYTIEKTFYLQPDLQLQSKVFIKTIRFKIYLYIQHLLTIQIMKIKIIQTRGNNSHLLKKPKIKCDLF